MKTSDIPTRETFAFVSQWVQAGMRVLEVGCGTGELARLMADKGFYVTALDSSEEAVATAVQLGVDARLAAWPDFHDQPFDAVLFTRSLHHISPLEPALDRVSQLLTPGGRLIVDDFSYHEVDDFTKTWFYHQLNLLDGAKRLRRDAEPFGTKLLAAKGDPEIWHHEHEHTIHPADFMVSAIEGRFRLTSSNRVPYLFRYLCQMLPESPWGAKVAARFLALEQHLGRERPASLIGRQWVAVGR